MPVKGHGPTTHSLWTLDPRTQTVFWKVCSANEVNCSQYFYLEIRGEMELDITSITKRDNFGRLLTLALQKGLREQTKDKMMELLYNGSGILCNVIGGLSKSSIQSNGEEGIEKDEEIARIQNALKIFVFLIVRLIVSEEWVDSNVQGKSKSKQKFSDSNKIEKYWCNSKRSMAVVLSSLINLLDLDLKLLWDFIDCAFLDLFIQPVFSVLGNPTNCKNEPIRGCCVRLIFLLITKYDFFDGCISQIMHATRVNGNIVAFISELVENLMSDEERAEAFISRLLGEVLTVSSNDSLTASEFPKTLGHLIESITEKSFKIVIRHIDTLLGFLGNKSHWIRNAVIKSIAKIIIHGFDEGVDEYERIFNFLGKQFERVQNGDGYSLESIFPDHGDADDGERDEGSGLDRFLLRSYEEIDRRCGEGRGEEKESADDEKGLRDLLFDVLIERVRDVNSFTRSQVLQAWTGICEADRIPILEYNRVTKVLMGRIRDKTSIVRKSAVRLICELLVHNPYHRILSRGRWVEFRQIVEDGGGGGEELRETSLDDEGALTIISNVNVRCVDMVLEFISLVSEATVCVANLLNSKNITDVVEAVHFLSRAKVFSLENVDSGIKTVLKLVCSPEQAIKDAACQAYIEMYLRSPSPGIDASLYIAQNLISLTRNVTLGQLISLKELLHVLYKTRSSELDAVVNRLYGIFMGADHDLQVRRGSVVVMNLLFEIHPNYITAWISPLIHHGLRSSTSRNFQLIKWTCLALQKVEILLKPPPASFKKAAHFNREFFQCLVDILLFEGDESRMGPAFLEQWFPAAEQVINLIYALSTSPGSLMGQVIRSASQKVFDESSVSKKHSSSRLKRLIFIVGQTILKQALFLEEVFFQKRLARRSAAEQLTAENDLEVVANEVDADETELQEERSHKAHLESLIDKNLLGKFLPLIIELSSNSDVQMFDGELHGVATNALCRFMLVSSRVCSQNMPLICKLLADSRTSSAVRQNLIITLNDIAIKFPNEYDLHSDVLFDRLNQEEDKLVRRNALQVLCHLILTFITKPRGRLGDIALCLESPDEHTSHLAHLFFQKLIENNKSDYVKLLSEILSSLNILNVKVDKYNDVVEYLLSFLESQKDLIYLIEKLVLQFRNNTDVDSCARMAYCISVLNHNEATFTKLVDTFKYYKHVLYNEEVKENFLSLVQNKKFKDLPVAKKLHKMIVTEEDAIMDVDEPTSKEKKQPPKPSAQAKIKRRTQKHAV